jgi:MoxR-like ATPase
MDLTRFTEKIEAVKSAIASVIVGQENAVDLVLTAILANGHVLIEGVPGVAKTLLARLVARLVDADFSRVQFTPDLMPSDVLGTTVFNMKTSDFDFHQGPIFADIVLVDEINRAPAKTQAALFEVMEERQVSIDGTTHRMGQLYTILATQNPVEQEGTYKLPEAQLDRFLMKITMDYPSLDEEVDILRRHHTNTSLVKLDDVKPVLAKEELLSLRTLMEKVFVEHTLLRYIALIVQQTRTSKSVYLGASPRASVAMLQASKAYAMLRGRDFVTPEDIKFVAPYVLQHRLILTAEAEMEGFSPVKITNRLIDKVEVPK